MWFPPGVHEFDRTLEVGPGDTLDMAPGAELVYTGTGTAVRLVGHPNAVDPPAGPHRVRVRRRTVDWPTTDTDSVGVELVNVNWADVHVDVATGFETGLLLRGDRYGCAYNKVHLGRVTNNRRNIRFAGTNGGWANVNTFLGGFVRHDSQHRNHAGTICIDLSEAGNGNTFVGVAVEGNASERTVVIGRHSNNVFVNLRYEANRPASFHLMPGSTANHVIGGYENFGPGSAIFRDEGHNIITGARGTTSFTDSGSAAKFGGGVAAFEARSLTSGNDVLFRGRNAAGASVFEVDARGRARFGGGELYVERGVLKWAGPDGTVTTLA